MASIGNQDMQHDPWRARDVWRACARNNLMDHEVSTSKACDVGRKSFKPSPWVV